MKMLSSVPWFSRPCLSLYFLCPSRHCPMSHAKFCLVSHLGCPIYTNTECKKADKTKSQGEALSSLSHRPLSRLPCAEKYVTCEFHDNTEYRPCCLSCVKTLFQLGLPVLVLDLRPMIEDGNLLRAYIPKTF